MLLSFNLQCCTFFSQTVRLQISYSEENELNFVKHFVEMKHVNAEYSRWQAQLSISEGIKCATYKYCIINTNKNIEEYEWGQNREINIAQSNKHIYLTDTWRSMSNPAYVMLSKAMCSSVFKYAKRHEVKIPTQLKENIVKVTFRLAISRIKNEHYLALKSDFTGSGNPCKIIPMSNTQHPVWQAEIDIDYIKFPFEYKYCIVEKKTDKIVYEEGGENRIFQKPENNSHITAIVVTDECFRFRANWKCAGTNIPVFSLRSKKSGGVGEFADIKLLVDWVCKTNMKVIQILPVNDTTATCTWVDSYPYSGISVNALHPLYVNISSVGKLNSLLEQSIITERGEYLNSLSKVDYEAVIKLKMMFFRKIYNEQRQEIWQNPDFLEFYETNKKWLQPYSAFLYLRDMYQTTDFEKWGKYAIFSHSLCCEICDAQSPHFDNIAINYFIQYHAHKQLGEAALYAQQHGIILKGDLPIGVLRNSVDVWTNPDLFNINEQIGAPPDDFTAAGQNWKFPTYNWNKMSKDNYKWWEERLKKMSNYFDAFRIDHILGFFRIWQIEATQTQGLMGRFNPSLAFSVDELKTKGLDFDFERMCMPYIRQYFLEELFGEYADEVRLKFFEEYSQECYKLKEQFDTQQKIEKAFELSINAEEHIRQKQEYIKQGLLTLSAEILFLKAPETENMYVPRFFIHKTKSYHDLNPQIKEKLDEIYNDYFYKRNECFWKRAGLQKLPVIKNAADMLVCGEDLGLVPQCVPELMAQLGILSLEIQRMPKQPDKTFGNTDEYKYMSVAATSSHDTTPLRGWWEEDPARSQQFYNTILERDGNSSFYCEYWIVKQIIEQHLASPSMIAIFPIQDLLGMSEELRYWNAKDERVNDPANPTHYWRYRMHLYIEDLIEQSDFNKQIAEMIEQAGRNSIY